VIAGIATLLKQFHASYLKSVLLYIGLYVRSMLCLNDDNYDSDDNDNDNDNDVDHHDRMMMMMMMENNDSTFGSSSSDPNVMIEVKNVIIFTLQLCSICGVSRCALYEYIPEYIMELIR